MTSPVYTNCIHRPPDPSILCWQMYAKYVFAIVLDMNDVYGLPRNKYTNAYNVFSYILNELSLRPSLSLSDNFVMNETKEKLPFVI
jgi:hypothetical protein